MKYKIKDGPLKGQIVDSELLEEVKEYVWKPGERETYYYVDNDGDILKSFWSDRLIHNGSYAIGNVFRTVEEAQKRLNWLEAEIKIKRWAEEHNEGWQPDWSDEEKEKPSIGYNHIRKELDCTRTTYFQMSLIYYKSEEIAKQAIKELKEEYLTYFGIK